MSKELQKTENKSIIKAEEAKPLLYANDLTISDIQRADNINALQKEVILAALNYPKIRAIKDEFLLGTEIYEYMASIIDKTIWESGITLKVFPQEEREQFIPIAIEEIKNEYYLLSVEEVRIAFKRGVRKKYGDFFGINITTINSWLDSYIESTKESTMLMLPFIKPEEKKPKEYTEEEKQEQKQFWLNGVYNDFNYFKDTGDYNFIDFQNSFYEYCNDLGLIKLNKKQRVEIWNKATAICKADYSRSKATSFGQKLDFKKVLDKIKEGKDESVKDMIKSRSKKIAIRYLFKDLVSAKKDLKEVIEKAITKKKENENKQT
jgi:hypothetical protein